MICTLLRLAGLFAAPAFFSCSGKETAAAASAERSDSATIVKLDTAQHLAGYAALRERIETKRKELAKDYTEAADDGARKEVIGRSRRYLNQMLADSLFPFWYGTTWDFNGTTQKPRCGSVACGYFVTTTMKHAGFNIERAKMAQVASSILIRKSCEKEKIKVFSNGRLDAFKAWLKEQPDGIYILGLDIHVSYIVKRGKKFDMVHSSYWAGTLKVTREALTDCPIIPDNKFFMAGNLLGSDSTIVGWLEGKVIAP